MQLAEWITNIEDVWLEIKLPEIHKAPEILLASRHYL